MRLTLHEHGTHYRLAFSFRVDKVQDEQYTMCLPKAESPAELALILVEESHTLRQAIMRHIRGRCGQKVALTYPQDDDETVFDDD